jgi:amino acid permease
MNSKYIQISKMITLVEGVIGSAAWGGGPYLISRRYEREALKEQDPEKKQQLMDKARQLKATAIGGAIGGSFPAGSVIGGPIGAAVGYNITKPAKKT